MKMLPILLFQCLFLFVTPPVKAKAQVVGFQIVKPTGTPTALLTLPGSTRRLAVKCTSGCSTASVAGWSVAKTTGGASATLAPSASGNFVDVTLGSAGGSCPVSGAGKTYGITANATVTLQATSKDDSMKSDSFVLNVCSPAVEAYTIPFYRVLYAGQREDVQGVIWGSSNTDGFWSVQSQPGGGDATLDDYNNRDTVFHASVKGTYKIRWTSAADSSKTAYSTFYVTGNKAPRNVQPNGTEPIDCTPDPTATGPVLEVGPTQKYRNLEAIVPSSTVPGTTIRLHNEDTTGKNPTTYHEWIQITTAGTHDNPIRLCGVPDAAGNLPVMDGVNATARADVLDPTYIPGYAGIVIYAKNYDWYPNYTGPQYIVVEGLAIRNYAKGNNYYLPGSTSQTAGYIAGSSGFNFLKCRDCELNGSEIAANGNGVFAEANDASSWGGVSMRLLFEGNNVHDNGVTNDYHEHNWYVQAWFQVSQFNQTPSYNPTALGSMYKDRGMSWFRYNMVGPGALRVLDFVEDQDAPNYLNPTQYLTNMRVNEVRDQYTGDQLAAAQEAWHHSAYVYGNVFESATGSSIHFWADNMGGYTARTGSLEFYNNTVNAALPATGGSSGVYRNYLFDTGDNGNNFPHVDWPVVNIDNVAAGGWNSSTKPFFFWNSQRVGFLKFGKVAVPPSWGTNAQSCTNNNLGQCDGTGWAYQSNTDAYFDGNGFNASGTGNFVNSGSSVPWDANYNLKQYVTGLPLTGNQARLPVRFQYLPAAGYAIARATVVTDVTGGEIGGIDAVPPAATPTPTPVAPRK